MWKRFQEENPLSLDGGTCSMLSHHLLIRKNLSQSRRTRRDIRERERSRRTYPIKLELTLLTYKSLWFIPSHADIKFRVFNPIYPSSLLFIDCKSFPLVFPRIFWSRGRGREVESLYVLMNKFTKVSSTIRSFLVKEKLSNIPQTDSFVKKPNQQLISSSLEKRFKILLQY